MQIVFKDCDPLNVVLDDTPLAQRWADLVYENYHRNPTPIFRDPPRYTHQYLEKLAAEANQKLGWTWNVDDLSLSSTTSMHKDIEVFLSNGYANIPEEFDNLLHEIHFCLHAVESGSKRNSWLQIEWFNDDGFDLPAAEYPAKIGPQFGDIRLQNPYVGHHPLYLYEQNDRWNISQTCKFHDFVRPGINIVIHDFKQELDWKDYIDWWQNNAEDFIKEKGLDSLIAYTGHPIIGRVDNLDTLKSCLDKNYLELECIRC
jgi:hypothetical protein